MLGSISIGSDHAGFVLKNLLIDWLKTGGHIVNDQGCYSEERADYPDYGHKVAESVVSGASGFGILLCGSGNGIAMTANKHRGIRAALCWKAEIAELARQHNDANILVLPARFLDQSEAVRIVQAFMNSSFEGGRHAGRLAKIDL